VPFGFITPGGVADWVVLDIQNNRALLLLNIVVDARAEDDPPFGLRFSQFDEQYIADTELDFPYDLPHGAMFLLSREEVEHYLPNPDTRRASTFYGDTGWSWVLRSPVETDGEWFMVDAHGQFATYYPAVAEGIPAAMPVRPAIWIDISKE